MSDSSVRSTDFVRWSRVFGIGSLENDLFETVEKMIRELPDAEAVKEFLTKIGAQPDNLDNEGLKLLAADTNARRAPAMKALYGELFKRYKDALPVFIERYEANSGHSLPALEPSGDKTSGMIQYFGLLSAYAFGALSREQVTEELRVRFLNGLYWQLGRKEERLLIRGMRPSSIPPGFELWATDEMLKWIGE